MFVRRLLSIPILFLATLTATALAPALLLVAIVASLLPPSRGAIATLGFGLGYLWSETIGIVRLFWVWLVDRNDAGYFQRNLEIQYWWTRSIEYVAMKCYRIQFNITGEDALQGEAALMFPRHTSIADTLLPFILYAVPHQVSLAYVLKQELLFDPCLDVAGNRLDCLFVDRSGQDSEHAVASVKSRVARLKDRQGLVIFAEGTRYTEEKHAQLSAKNDPRLTQQLERWPDLLPPRLGGTLAILEANTQRDLVFLAHRGFEKSSTFSSLLNGSWLDAKIDVQFWRVPFREIPANPNQLTDFFFAQWDEMQRVISEWQQPS